MFIKCVTPFQVLVHYCFEIFAYSKTSNRSRRSRFLVEAQTPIDAGCPVQAGCPPGANI